MICHHNQYAIGSRNQYFMCHRNQYVICHYNQYVIYCRNQYVICHYNQYVRGGRDPRHGSNGPTSTPLHFLTFDRIRFIECSMERSIECSMRCSWTSTPFLDVRQYTVPNVPSAMADVGTPSAMPDKGTPSAMPDARAHACRRFGWG